MTTCRCGALIALAQRDELTSFPAFVSQPSYWIDRTRAFYCPPGSLTGGTRGLHEPDVPPDLTREAVETWLTKS